MFYLNPKTGIKRSVSFILLLLADLSLMPQRNRNKIDNFLKLTIGRNHFKTEE